MLSSSVQATLIGRYGQSDYGKSKLAGEELFFSYAQETGTHVFVYRFPNLFGKWCRPNYNSAVATFCSNMANDLPITVNDRNTELELVYIDDLVTEMLDALEDKAHRCDYDGLNPVPSESGKYCYVPVSHKETLGHIVDLLERFKNQPKTLMMPEIPQGSFEKKLYSTYLSYLPKEKVSFPLKMNTDVRGSFTELIKTEKCGQVSVNISKPGITKGEHWHNTKWEFFIVVSGHGLIRERKIGTDEILDFEVSGEKIEAVHMLPGYTHNIINLSDTEPLITVMWGKRSVRRGSSRYVRREGREMSAEMKLDYSDIKFKEDGRLKLLIVVGTRPEIIRLAAVITKCRKYFDCILAHTGQNYDYTLNGIFFRDLKLQEPEVYMNAVGDDLGATVGEYHQLFI